MLLALTNHEVSRCNARKARGRSQEGLGKTEWEEVLLTLFARVGVVSPRTFMMAVCCLPGQACPSGGAAVRQPPVPVLRRAVPVPLHHAREVFCWLLPHLTLSRGHVRRHALSFSRVLLFVAVGCCSFFLCMRMCVFVCPSDPAGEVRDEARRGLRPRDRERATASGSTPATASTDSKGAEVTPQLGCWLTWSQVLSPTAKETKESTGRLLSTVLCPL